MLSARDASRFCGSVVRLLAINASVAIQRCVALAIERAGVELRDEPLRIEPAANRRHVVVAVGRCSLFAVELGVLFRSPPVQPPVKAT